MTTAGAPTFAVIPGRSVQEVLSGQEHRVVDLIEAAYRLHGDGHTVNPPSYFLRFPDRPNARIIALPASVGAEVDTAGLKWVASFPDNVADGLPRASAVLMLNDRRTGYPFACLEGSVISASRTAASAALAAVRLSTKRSARGWVGFFGTGLIARYVHRYLAAVGWPFEHIGVYDSSADRARGFTEYLRDEGEATPAKIYDDAQALIRSSDVVVFATSASTPHVTDTTWFAHTPLVLHVSLRDLAPEVVLASVNVLDDVEHCLKANTSVHLAEQITGKRDFVDGVLYDALTGSFDVPAGRTVIFSPFGLGVLDLVLGNFVYEERKRAGELTGIDGFFSELSTYGTTGARQEGA